jgi:2-oxo-3-hexenedioate decarboxylase
MYDNTVRYTVGNDAALSIAGRVAPRIEPEIVFKLARPLGPGADAATALAAIEWMALGFEINDCVFPDWKFTPLDFVAAFGFHVALVVGPPAPAAPPDALAAFTLTLSKNGAPVETGSGKNALRSPALCLAELATAISRRPGAEPLAAGELVSTGTLTTPQPVTDGDVWQAEVTGLDLPALTLTVTA